MSTHTALERTPLTQADARALTDRIKGTTEQLWQLLLEAHEREAWKVLGYPSWRAYAKRELAISQSHAYRLLDQGRVIRQLEAAANSPVGEIPESVARDIKPHIAEVADRVREHIADGEPPAAAVQHAVAAARQRPTAIQSSATDVDIRARMEAFFSSRKRQDSANRSRCSCAERMADYAELVEDIDYATIDRALISTWVKDLRQGARAVQRFADRLEREGRR